MTNFDAEIGIIGAGPAGARAAELLARAGADVLCWDPKAPWEKPCGGGLTAAARKDVPELAELGAVGRWVDTARAEVGNAGACVTLDRPILMVARRALAEWQLRRMIEAGARLESVAVTLVDRDRRGGWVVGARDGRRWRVRRLVGADGAASRTRAAAAPTLRIGLEPTRVAYPTVAGSTDGTAVIRFFPGVEGYAWIFPRADHFSIGMVAVGEGWRRERLDAEVGRLAAGSLDGDMPRMPRAGAVIGSALHSLSTSVESLSGPDFALLGDAAGLADPASGEGIRNALRSAEFLSEAYAIDGTFARYGRIVVERLEPGFRRARLERRLMYDLGFAARLVRAATRSSLALALGKALVDAANEPGQGWIRRWLRGWWLASRPSA